MKEFVLKAVSEKTGYPVEMLDLDLDLEADLGIDTVKQAELFATIRTHFDIPRREDLHLADYNNLTKVIGFMHDALIARNGAAGENKAGTIEAEPGANLVSAGNSPVKTMEQTVGRVEQLLNGEVDQVITRRVPLPVLRPRLELCTPSGVELGEGSRVFVVGDRGKTGESLAKRLRGRKAQVMIVSGDDPDEVERKAVEFSAQGAVDGVYFLTGLDEELPLEQMSHEQWFMEIERRATTLFRLMRAIPGEPFLVSATRMGGLHGFEPDGAAAPLGGLVSGFTKALAQERPGKLVKVVDFEQQAGPADISSRLLAETMNDSAVVEVGWKENLRYSITPVEQPAVEADFELTKESVYVVSGGSGGITAPVVLDLAQHCGGTFFLLSRTALPGSDDADLKQLTADRNAFKAEMGRRLKEKGEKATPAAVDQKLASLDRAAATLETINAAQRAGATVKYIICDVTDGVACEAAIEQVLAEAGRVDVFIHAAGADRSRKIEAKPLEEYRQIISVKADGFFNLFKAFTKFTCIPKAMVFFSSVAGRFGNSGQTDYSAANDLLGKIASSLPRQVPGMKVVSLDWGAWAEVGMASRGYIPELMKRAGIEMLHPAAAAPLVRQELLHGRSGDEVVLAGSLGILSDQSRQDGGLDLVKANDALTSDGAAHIMLTRATGFNIEEGVILEADLDPTAEPFLRDHALNGIPLLPGVMGIEGLSTASQHIASRLASEKGSFRVTGLENIQFLAPFKFYRNQPRRVTWKARVIREGGELVAYASLESTLTRYGRDPERMLHFTGKVLLSPVSDPREEKTGETIAWKGGDAIQSEEIYKLYFHGPSFQVLEAVVREGESVVGKLRSDLPPITNTKEQLSTQPILVELCLQTAGIWEIGATGTMALPRSIASLKVYRVGMNGSAIYAEVTQHENDDGRPSFDARVLDAKGRVYLEMEDYRTEPLPYSVEQEQLIPIQGLMNRPQE